MNHPSTPTPEFQFVAVSALHPLRQDEVDQLRQRCETLLNWETAMILARRHKVVPLLSFNIERYIPYAIPPDIHLRLQAKHERQQQRASALVDELLSITHLFQSEGIPTGSLKGPVLSKQLFGDVALRSNRDLDVLTLPERVSQAEQILLAAGYEHKEPSRAFTFRQRQAYAWLHHHNTYRHPEKRITFELHWSFASTYLVPPAVIRQIVARAQSLDWAGTQLGVLTLEDTLAFLLVHGAKHRWARLKYLADLDAFARSKLPIDWHRLAANMAEWRLQRPLAQGFLLARWMLGTQTPAPIQRIADHEPMAQALAAESRRALLEPHGHLAVGGPFTSFQHARYMAKLKPGLRYPASYLMSFLLFSLNDWNEVDLPDHLLPLYFVLRPFLWLRRYYLRQRPKTPIQ